VPKHIPALAIRAAVVATTTAAAALVAVLPAATASAAPAAPATAPASAPAFPAAPAAIPAAFAVPAAQPVTLPVAPVALTTPAPAAAVPTAVNVSAVNLAMSKLGAPYRWGAAGPNAFDCSGLVSWAYKNVGVSLPRTSRAMSTVGTPVAKADLRPGDLVFFYTPVSHVGMYIGDGKIVHASSSKSPVKVSSMAGMPFHNARRL